MTEGGSWHSGKIIRMYSMHLTHLEEMLKAFSFAFITVLIILHLIFPGDPIPLPLVPASVWTRKDITEFKKDILANQRECCIKIASLASATVSMLQFCKYLRN